MVNMAGNSKGKSSLLPDKHQCHSMVWIPVHLLQQITTDEREFRVEWGSTDKKANLQYIVYTNICS